MSTTIAIIPCGGEKTATPAAARDLYTGQMFRTALTAAEAQCDEVLILSAKHGLISLDTIVEPYDLKMGDEGSVSEYEVQLTAQVHGIEHGTQVFAFLPSAYLSVLDPALRALDVHPQDVYEADAGIGYQRGTCRAAREVS